MKLGDTVLYTAAHENLNVRVAIISAIHDDGSVELCCLDAEHQRVVWLHKVKVTGAAPGSEEASGKWCSR